MDREKAVRCIELMEETFSDREVYDRIGGMFEQLSDELATEEKVHVIPNKVRDYLIGKLIYNIRLHYPPEEGVRTVRKEAIDIMEKMK